MNPFDNVGTLRISTSFYDRLCRLVVGYQSAGEDEEIVALRTGCDRNWPGTSLKKSRTGLHETYLRLYDSQKLLQRSYFASDEETNSVVSRSLI